MDKINYLHVQNDQIVTADNQPIFLRGTAIGGWMNMEDFINGYPGVEYALRATFAEIMGPQKASWFFDTWLDDFLAEDDIAFMKKCGATVTRLSLNYRHFESDQKPFTYLESGFKRLDQALSWCRQHGLYAILDMHTVPGWQNPDWHSDNATRHTLFWDSPHYQERFIALWQEFARRYQDHPEVAGYDLMNEPVTNAPRGFLCDPWPGFPGKNSYRPRWQLMNDIYRRTVEAIRKIDARHIIFLEGDLYAAEFDGLELPAGDNIAISSHNYIPTGFGPGAYPGTVGGTHWDRPALEKMLLNMPAVKYAKKHKVPLWVGEFGSAYNVSAEERPSRLRSMDDQIAIYNENNLHWTTWTYKDVGVMGWVELDKQSPYLSLIEPILEAKQELGADMWMGWLPATPAKNLLNQLAVTIEKTIPDSETAANANCKYYLLHAAIGCYASALMQPAFAKLFAARENTDIERLLGSFRLKNCRPNEDLLAIVRKHMAKR